MKRMKNNQRRTATTLRETMSQYIHRGKVNISLQFTPSESIDLKLAINMPLAKAISSATKTLADLPDVQTQFRAIDLLRWPGIIASNKIDVDAIQESEKLKIPEGTESGEVFKLSGKGMPRLHARGYGDMYVEVHVKTPKKLSRKTRKIVEELEKELEERNRKY